MMCLWNNYIQYELWFFNTVAELFHETSGTAGWVSNLKNRTIVNIHVL
jgi:hypothetical protein